RSVAARHDYDDVITKERIPAVTTAQIYKGSIAFIVLQIIMVGVILFNPGLVSGNIEKVERISKDKVEDMLNIETIDYNSNGSSNDNW
ncbi:MAG: C4-dicarboxylate ABC transporter, partial [Burkholderiaceae bacterium]